MNEINTKQKIISAIDELPDKIKVEDAIEKLYLFYKIEKGLKQAEEGKTVPHNVVREKLGKWFE
ncbi:MAG: hypothetical protein AB1521_07110 [Bacteroidota bacterium]